MTVKANNRNVVRDESDRLKMFWNTRYSEFTLRESGIRSLTPLYSELLYQCKQKAYYKALKIAGIDTKRAVSILDGGCGQGFFASLAAKFFRTINYTGVDISEKAVAFLKPRFPNFEWVCADLCNTEFGLSHDFDVAQSIEVLHLILDDNNHYQAINNLVTYLRPHGTLIITDTLPEERYLANEYIVFRPLGYYKSMFDILGLQLLDIFPMYYWVPDMGTVSWPLKKVCRLLPPKLIYALDRICLNLKLPQFAQSHDSHMKMILCRKRGE